MWEGLAFAKRHNPRNLAVHVNANGFSAYDAVDRDDLKLRLLSFCPWVVVHFTSNPEFPHMRGLEGHYHVLKTEAESAELAGTLLGAASSTKPV